MEEASLACYVAIACGTLWFKPGSGIHLQSVLAVKVHFHINLFYLQLKTF